MDITTEINRVVQLVPRKQQAPHRKMVAVLKLLLERAESGELDGINCQFRMGGSYSSIAAGGCEGYSAETHDHFCGVLALLDRQKRERRMGRAAGRVVALRAVKS